MELLIEQKRRILRLTLNRPEKRNALTYEMCKGITQAVSSAQNDAQIGSILICSAGPVFCSGMDLDEANSISSDALADSHEALFSIGARSRKPIVLSVNGAALGGGLGLVAQGHVVVASTGTAFGLPEVRIGLWPFLVYRSVEAALGQRRTLELSLTGRLFHAPEALHWGLIHHMAPAAEVADRAKGIATDLERASPEAIKAGLGFRLEAEGLSSDAEGDLARKYRAKLMESGDFKEGYEAFKRKREPHWPSMPRSFYEGKQPVPASVRPEEIGTGE
jgi:enoyl-CoA hydratase/carnithine racemase